ncbi:hypothetical protein ABH926_009000 [Catenulispora sp. GP43]
MSATGSNGNENTAGHAQAGRSAEHDAVLRALLRARRDGSAPVPGVFGLDAGPEPEPDDVPLRSRGGGVNKPRAVVPTPLLATEAARLVDAAHTKRARMVSAIGLPAVFLAATGVAVVPTVANAASASSSAPAAASTNCAPGSTAQANPGIKGTAPSSAPSSAPTSAPSSGPTSSSSSTKAGTTAKTPGAPQPSSGSTTAPPAAPSSRPSSAPSGTTSPAKPSPTGVPTAPAPTSSTSTKPAAPTSTPSPSPSSSSSAPWWDPLGWLGTTVNGVFNPAPTSSSSSSTVNKLSAAPAANPTSDPTSSASPILSIGLGGSSSSSSSPSTPPTSKPSTPTPTTPQPTSSESKPSAPAPTSTSSSSAPTTAPSTTSSSSSAPGTITYQGKTYQLPATSCVAAVPAGALREVEWHLDASSLTLTNQKFEGFQDVNTGDGKTVQVMVIHADRVDLTDMVTYNEDGKTKVYSDGGKGKNVTLTNVTLHVLQQKGVMDLPILGIPLGQVTLGPPGEAGTDATSQLVMGLLQLNLPLPPVTFTDVHVDQYTLTSDTLDIPHFNVGLNGTTPQY